MSEGIPTRDCPACGKEISYNKLASYLRAKKDRCVCRKCANEQIGRAITGRKHTALARRRMSKAKSGENHPNFGKRLSPKTRDKIARGRIGKEHTAEAKANMRRAMLKIAKLNGAAPCHDSYVTRVCHEINRVTGWNGRHAGNGKEKMIIRYFVDYYAELADCILIIEFDGKYHNRPSRIEKDLIRQRRIIEEVKSKGNECVFLRWDVVKDDWKPDFDTL